MAVHDRKKSKSRFSLFLVLSLIVHTGGMLWLYWSPIIIVKPRPFELEKKTVIIKMAPVKKEEEKKEEDKEELQKQTDQQKQQEQQKQQKQQKQLKQKQAPQQKKTQQSEDPATGKTAEKADK